MALDPRDFAAPLGMVVVAMMDEEWAGTDPPLRRLGGLASPFDRWLSLRATSLVRAGQGRSDDWLRLLDEAGRMGGASTRNRVQAKLAEAQALLQLGKPDAALSVATGVRADAESQGLEVDALYALTVAQAESGRLAEARASLASLEALAEKIPGDDPRRAADRARGHIALAQGDAALAIDAFARAESTMTPRGYVTAPNLHVTVWFELATAHLSAKRETEAAQWLARITSAGFERVADMTSYVRAHFLAAELLSARGDTTRARELYGRFLDHWRDGDTDCDNVAVAERAVGR